MRLVPNAGEVALKASSMWALYGAFVIDAGIKVLQYLQENREVKWQDALMPIALIVIGAARLIQQKALATATERKLAEEKITRQVLEGVATSAGPPITQEQVKAIKKDAADATSAEPVKNGVLRE
jgi:hypothetical protein